MKLEIRDGVQSVEEHTESLAAYEDMVPRSLEVLVARELIRGGKLPGSREDGRGRTEVGRVLD